MAVLEQIPTVGLVGLSAREFFALDFPDGRMIDAQRTLGLAYSTLARGIRRRGATRWSPTTLERLERWSLGLSAASERGLYLSAKRTRGEQAP